MCAPTTPLAVASTGQVWHAIRRAIESAST
jgi:hypothetical protein